jgi:hypothetical protein
MSASVMRDLYDFRHYARLTIRSRRKVCLVVHGQNSSAVLHVDHPLGTSRCLRHEVDKAISKISASEIAPKSKGNDQDQKGAQ